MLVGAVPAAAPAHAADAEIPAWVAWLDHPLPTDAEAGSQLDVGLMLWDNESREPIAQFPPFVRIHPATGDAEPSMAGLVEDWSGHYRWTIEVPAGGLGKVEVGLGGTACDANGCQRQEQIYPIAGVGPPPDASPPMVAEATIEVVESIAAGTSTEVTIRLTPNTDWDEGAFAVPDGLVLQVRQPRGGVLDELPAPLLDADDLAYRASLSLAEPGEFVLQAASTANAEAKDTFGESLIAVTVTPAPPPPAASGSGPDLLWVAIVGGLAILTLGVVFAVRRA
jgi:hypothetical protein